MKKVSVREVYNAGGDALGEGRGMGNEYEADAATFGFGDEETPDLGLRDRVEHRGYFVSHEVARVRRQRAGNAETLQLAAGKLMRIAPQPLPLNPQVIKQLLGYLTRLGKRLLHSHPRINRRFRMLQNKLHRTHPARRQRLAVDEDVALERPLKPRKQPTKRRLPKPRRRHQSHSLISPNSQTEVPIQRLRSPRIPIGYPTSFKHAFPLFSPVPIFATPPHRFAQFQRLSMFARTTTPLERRNTGSAN